jgi:glycosyltransferase involved in cell wall biosynthesis
MKSKIAFIWQGITGRYGIWKDGLYAAMKRLEKEYEVTYHEPQDDIPSDAVVLYWEAPCTINSPKDSHNYRRVMNLPNKKILLFAGGQVQKEWVRGFDMVCVESKINKDEFNAIGVRNLTAFGINEKIFKPKPLQKIYDGIHHGTCASWKRQWLVGEALGSKGVVVGRDQAEDPFPFRRCRELGCTVLSEKDPTEVCDLINQSHTCVQTSDYWGGGQRCTLEAMACNVFPIVMTDSPKNREYVEESGFGTVCEPSADAIRKAVHEATTSNATALNGRKYIMSKWTSKHYADNLKKAINEII